MRGDLTTDRLLAAVSLEWVDAEELMEPLMATVAPGKALRQYQNQRSRNKGTGTRPQLTEDEQIASGQRHIVNERIASQVASRRLEIERDSDGKRRVRLRERRELVSTGECCQTCNRPFPEATVEQKPQLPSPRLRPKILYPVFPQWGQTLRDGSSG